MSRFFKSAAFPILIVVVLAFFAQKLIGSSSHQQHYSFGDLLTQLDSNSVKNVSIHTKDNTVDVTLTNGQKYTVGYPDDYAATLINKAQTETKATGGTLDVQGKTYVSSDSQAFDLRPSTSNLIWATRSLLMSSLP